MIKAFLVLAVLSAGFMIGHRSVARTGDGAYVVPVAFPVLDYTTNRFGHSVAYLQVGPMHFMIGRHFDYWYEDDYELTGQYPTENWWFPYGLETSPAKASQVDGMIMVDGLAGNRGWAYAREMDPLWHLPFTNLEEAREFRRQFEVLFDEYGDHRLVDVYAFDGVTVIDSVYWTLGRGS